MIYSNSKKDGAYLSEPGVAGSPGMVLNGRHRLYPHGWARLAARTPPFPLEKNSMRWGDLCSYCPKTSEFGPCKFIANQRPQNQALAHMAAGFLGKSSHRGFPPGSARRV